MTPKRQILIVLTLCVGLALLWWLKQDPTQNNFNQLLRTDPQLGAYPFYQVRVLKVENGDGHTVAVLSSPRSPNVSVLQFLNLTQPALSDKSPDSPEVIAAQKALAQMQEKARKLIEAQPGISGTRWEIDKDWYAQHGLIVE